MTYIKRLIAVLIVFLLVTPVWAFQVGAANEKWIFIDGENITRQTDKAVIYYGVKTTGQDKWGYGVVVNSNGEVIATYDRGSAEGENLEIPEGGYVISSSGSKANWFEDNISVGNTVFYDGYTQRLFIRDYYGNYNPYFEKSFEVTENNGEYILTQTEEVDNYRYKIIVDENGIIVSRGNDFNAPAGGFVVSAASESQRNNLITYGIIGAECSVNDGIVTFKFTENMLARSGEYAVNDAKNRFEKEKSQYSYMDIAQMEEILNQTSDTAKNLSSYRSLSSLLTDLYKKVNQICNDKTFSELRSAFHIPYEKNDSEVNATVLAAKAAGLNSIVLKVSNGFNTCIPMPDGFRFKQNSSFNNFDVLKGFIEACKRENMALTVSIDTYYNEYASIAAPEWLSATNGEDNGLALKYFSPASKDFQKYFLEYVDYIITYYEINSLVFDYLRYPKFNENCDLGFDNNTLKQFSDEKQIPFNDLEDLKTKLNQSKYWESWVEFKVGLVDGMAKSISDLVREKRSDITLLAVAERETDEYHYMQNPLGWIENGWFDGLCVSVFEADSDENDKLPENAYQGNIVGEKAVEFVNAIGNKAFVYPILETSASFDASSLETAVKDSRKVNCDGFVFGSLKDYISQNYSAVLRESLLKGDSVSSLANPVYAMGKILDFSKIKVNNLSKDYEICDDDQLKRFNGLIDTAKKDLETGALTSQQATDYRNDVDLIFAESPAKNMILKEFDAVVKIALLSKSNYGSYVPPQKPSDEKDENLSKEESSKDELSKEESSQENSQNQSSRIEINIDWGKVLIYVFVGVTFVAFVAALVVGVRRKNERPEHAHMPKGFEKKDK